jgi:activator of HSP90 ATPase
MSSSIHQEINFNASQKRIYDALTDAKQFGKFTGAPAEIDQKAGGAFSCFGGMITRRNIELITNQRIVQAWRVSNWPEGVYSIVRFELQEMGHSTNLVLDHTGFPDGADEHLAPEWKKMYWEPLATFLG